MGVSGQGEKYVSSKTQNSDNVNDIRKICITFLRILYMEFVPYNP